MMYSQIQDVNGRNLTGIFQIHSTVVSPELLEIVTLPLPDAQRRIIHDLPFVNILISSDSSFNTFFVCERAKLYGYEFFNQAPNYNVFYAKYTWHFTRQIVSGVFQICEKKAPKKRELPDYDWMVEGF